MGAIQDALDKYGNETVSIIQTNLSSTGTNASGQTSQSLKSESTPVKVTVSGKAFIFVVETGRGPTKGSSRGGPTLQRQILKWIQTGKPGITEKIESASWGISKFIHEHGTELFRKGGRKDIITPALDDKRLDKLTDTIADISFDKTIKVIEDGIASNN